MEEPPDVVVERLFIDDVGAEYIGTVDATLGKDFIQFLPGIAAKGLTFPGLGCAVSLAYDHYVSIVGAGGADERIANPSHPNLLRP